MSRALPLALTSHRRRDQPRAIPIPVSLAEQDTCRALEGCGVPPELIVRVVLPLARAIHLTHPRRNQ